MGIMRIMGKMRDRRRFVMKDCSGSAKSGAEAPSLARGPLSLGRISDC